MLRTALAFCFVFFASSAWAERTITWDALAPAVGAPMRIAADAPRAGAVQRADFDGSDDEFEFFLEDMEIMRRMQPAGGFLNSSLDGETVRIAGYVTPVGFDDETVSEFLFVPFLGACIHVPPPEANQIIYVTDAKGLTVDQLYEPVWLEGKLQAKPAATVLADVGYRMVGATARIYDGPADALEGERAVDND